MHNKEQNNGELAPHPFGSLITETGLQHCFSTLTSWEDRYRQLIQLAKQLPALPDDLKTAHNEIMGCENRVWLGYQQQYDGRLHFYGDSEGRIVRGLLALLLTFIEGKTVQQLQQQNLPLLFQQLGIDRHLSVSRHQGLAYLINAVNQIVKQCNGN